MLPYLDGIWIDAEDAVATERPYAIRPAGGRTTAGEMLRVAVIRLPRISNFTDIDALALEPGVAVRFVTTPAELADADLVVVPGTRATVADLGWLRGQGLDSALKRRAADRKPILAICGGYQMLGTVIHDDVESAAGAADGSVAGDGVFAGLGLLPVVTRFAADKTLGRPAGYAAAIPVSGYEIHHGVVDVRGGEPWFTSRPARSGRRRSRKRRDGARRLPLRRGQRHPVARDPGERRVPPGLSHRDRPARGPELRPRARYVLRRRPAGAVRHARRRRRGAPRYGRPAAAHRARADPRPAQPPAGTV